MEHIGIGEPGRKGRAGDIAAERGQGATLGVRGKILAVEIVVEGGIEWPCAQLCQEAMAHAHDFREQVVLRSEMSVEGTAREAGSQHDVIYVGASMAAQAEQPGGMLGDFAPCAGFADGVGGHTSKYVE
jgi:hypothetical protein